MLQCLSLFDLKKVLYGALSFCICFGRFVSHFGNFCFIPYLIVSHLLVSGGVSLVEVCCFRVKHFGGNPVKARTFSLRRSLEW